MECEREAYQIYTLPHAYGKGTLLTKAEAEKRAESYARTHGEVVAVIEILRLYHRRVEVVSKPVDSVFHDWE